MRIKRLLIVFLIISMTFNLALSITNEPTFQEKLENYNSMYQINNSDYSKDLDLDDPNIEEEFKYNSIELENEYENNFKIDINLDYETDEYTFDVIYKKKNSDDNTTIESDKSGYTFDDLVEYDNIEKISQFDDFNYHYFKEDISDIEYDDLNSIDKAIYDSKNDVDTSKSNSVIYNSELHKILSPFFKSKNTNAVFEPYFVDSEYGVTLDWGLKYPQYFALNFDYIIRKSFKDMINQINDYKNNSENTLISHYNNFNVKSDMVSDYGPIEDVKLDLNLNTNTHIEKDKDNQDSDETTSYNSDVEFDEDKLYEIFTYNENTLEDSKDKKNFLNFDLNMDYKSDEFAFDIYRGYENKETEEETQVESAGYNVDDLVGWTGEDKFSEYISKNNSFYTDEKSDTQYSQASDTQKLIYDNKEIVTDDTDSLLYNKVFYDILLPFFEYDNTSLTCDSYLLEDYGVTLDWGFDQPEYISTKIDKFLNKGVDDLYSDVSDFDFVDDKYFEFNLDSNSDVSYGVYEDIKLNFNINLRINKNNL